MVKSHFSHHYLRTLAQAIWGFACPYTGGIGGPRIQVKIWVNTLMVCVLINSQLNFSCVKVRLKFGKNLCLRKATRKSPFFSFGFFFELRKKVIYSGPAFIPLFGAGTLKKNFFCGFPKLNSELQFGLAFPSFRNCCIYPVVYATRRCVVLSRSIHTWRVGGTVTAEQGAS